METVKGKFKKGVSGNVKGRPKGTRNRITCDMRAFVSNLLDDNREQIESDLAQLKPYERLSIFEKLMSYSLPKLSSIDTNVTGKPMSSNIVLNVVRSEIPFAHSEDEVMM